VSARSLLHQSDGPNYVTQWFPQQAIGVDLGGSICVYIYIYIYSHAWCLYIYIYIYTHDGDCVVFVVFIFYHSLSLAGL
jgi:hypothetical protein